MFVESAAVHLHCAVGLEMVLRRPNDKGLNADGTTEGFIAQPLAHLRSAGQEAGISLYTHYGVYEKLGDTSIFVEKLRDKFQKNLKIIRGLPRSLLYL